MFNALKYSKELEEAGFSRGQAEATINVFFRFMEYNFSTKTDLHSVESSLRSDLKEMESSLRSDMKEMESGLRSDMKELESSLRTEIKSVETTLRSEMQAMKTSLSADIQDLRSGLVTLEHKMTIKLGVMQAASIGLFAVIIKFL